MAQRRTKSATSSAASTNRKPRAVTSEKKLPQKRRGHVHDEHCGHHEEIALNPAEGRAFDLVMRSENVRSILEDEATAAVAWAVRKVCKAHGAPLTAPEAKKLAKVFFNS
jgi:hypothetical protein